MSNNMITTGLKLKIDSNVKLRDSYQTKREEKEMFHDIRNYFRMYWANYPDFIRNNLIVSSLKYYLFMFLIISPILPLVVLIYTMIFLGKIAELIGDIFGKFYSWIGIEKKMYDLEEKLETARRNANVKI
jgi:hypothetical protein